MLPMPQHERPEAGDVGEVAGAQEAAHETVLGVLRLVPVAGHHLGTGDADLAGLALLDHDVRIVKRADGDLGAGQGKAD